MDIIDLLRREIFLESIAHAPRVPGSVEAMKLAIKEIERLRLIDMAQKLRRMHPESQRAEDLRRLIKEAEGSAG